VDRTVGGPGVEREVVDLDTMVDRTNGGPGVDRVVTISDMADPDNMVAV